MCRALLYLDWSEEYKERIQLAQGVSRICVTIRTPGHHSTAEANQMVNYIAEHRP